jgi:heterodisulfide reductase subunit C2
MSLASHTVDKPMTLADHLAHDTGVDVFRCYQCGKCSAGCPMAAEMDYPSSVLMRLLQTGDEQAADKAIASHSIWLCLSCETCYCRCPMEIDIPKVADYLRSQAMQQKRVHPAAKNIRRFHEAFLDTIHYTGRLYEVGLIADYKTRSWNLWQDVLKAPVLFFKGKLKLWPHTVTNRKALRKLFARSRNTQEVQP